MDETIVPAPMPVPDPPALGTPALGTPALGTPAPGPGSEVPARPVGRTTADAALASELEADLAAFESELAALDRTDHVAG